MTRLAQMVAMVTGGSAGQGAAVARRFAAEGAAVVVLDIDDEGGSAVVDDIIRAGGEATFVHCDVSEEEAWSIAVEAALADYSGIDIVYHNAAMFSHADGSVVEIEPDVWDRVMSVNVRSVYLGCRAVVPVMIERGGGSIIAVASIRASLGTSIPQDAYAASKGAIVSLMRSLAVHLAPHGIRANVISPGTIQTAMAPVADEAAAMERLTRYPMGRFGTVEDITGAATYLASSESAWTTGIELRVDGGTSCFYV